MTEVALDGMVYPENNLAASSKYGRKFRRVGFSSARTVI